MTRRGQSRTITTISTAALLAAGSVSWAQQAGSPSGLRFSLDLSAGASFNTNEGLDDPSEGNTTRTNLGATFGLLDETAVSRLAVSVFTRAEWAQSPDPDEDGFDFRIPSGTLSYTRRGADSSLELSGRYFYERVDDDVLIFLDENLNPVDLILDGGDLRRFTLGGAISLGISAPIGLDADAFLDNRDYIGTTDPDLFDRVSYGGSGALRFELTDVVTGRLTAAYSRRDDDDTGDPVTETVSYGAGVTYLIDGITTFNGDLSYTTIDETIFGVTQTENEGWAYDFGIARQTRDGSVGASLSQVVGETTTRTVIAFDRSQELPDGTLSYSIGYSLTDDEEDTRNGFVGALDYRRDLPSGSVTASASQEFVDNDEGDETLVSRIALNYNQAINSVSSFDVSFGLGRSAEEGDAGDVTTRANVGVSYRHALTQEWDWVLGYEARYSLEDEGDPATGNRVFTLIDRSFTFRP